MTKAIITSESRAFLLILENSLFLFLDITGRKKKWSKSLTVNRAVRVLPTGRNWAKSRTPHHVADVQVEVQCTYVWLSMLMAITDYLFGYMISQSVQRQLMGPMLSWGFENHS